VATAEKFPFPDRPSEGVDDSVLGCKNGGGVRKKGADMYEPVDSSEVTVHQGKDLLEVA